MQRAKCKLQKSILPPIATLLDSDQLLPFLWEKLTTRTRIQNLACSENRLF